VRFEGGFTDLVWKLQSNVNLERELRSSHQCRWSVVPVVTTTGTPRTVLVCPQGAPSNKKITAVIRKLPVPTWNCQVLIFSQKMTSVHTHLCLKLL